MTLPAFRVGLAFLLLIASGLLFAQTTRAPHEHSSSDPTAKRKTRGEGVGQRYYEDRERGWYWFEEDPDRIELEPIEDVPAVPGTPTTKELKPLSVEWLQVELEKARIIAIDNPTRENVEYYGYLEKISMDKAEKFALMRQQVAMVNPGLDETIDNPVTTIARTARRDQQDSEQSRILKDLAKTIGIYYFFKSDCPYCAKQNFTLNEVRKRYGFSVLAISIDGAPMPDGVFDQWVPDRGQAQMLNIQSTPTLYMVRPPNEVVQLSVGVQTLAGLEKRLLQVSRANEWIDEETFEKAMRGLPRQFLVDALEDMEGIDWSDPAQAMNALRYASQRGTERSTVNDLFNDKTQATPLQR